MGWKLFTKSTRVVRQATNAKNRNEVLVFEVLHGSSVKSEQIKKCWSDLSAGLMPSEIQPEMFLNELELEFPWGDFALYNPYRR